MGFLFGGMLLAALVVILLLARNRIRMFSRRIFGTPDLLDVLEAMDTEAEETPRSLNGCDSFLLPQILKDFPDFDVNHCKIQIRDYLKEKFGNKDAFAIHNVVIAKYLPSQVQKTIVFQAALAYRENGRLLQKRYDIYYSYILSGTEITIAANCPNCGGALGFGELECPFCGSRVTNPLGNSWEVTQLIET